ncbi:RNA15 (YGL044C) [Zygosaccharomyces parabailii]|uniref:ZYBA0S04-04786g1_1 n=1 Tax=Zygosaccharomyces bailii (strain CLIB 213 / ATCC 58445 / CBS 680 / BCRC 21525 / NBRC 1098 / NCYC 1416 / NRRL Y-2227) TaxID=1333698 RepID=A0A8J2X7X9_ZYGB2|nr:RNA15 (YGL044C) [Zygosaccharomyces parabailii]CDF89458.1 ZYBA0S04-04786g1_1 [Zygosaccharomyces bailii CLIB 213]CDH08422.1 related to mRNA 3'-end-processing protein RNA15 [Zygosaccharomyces bailii ISA1307]
MNRSNGGQHLPSRVVYLGSIPYDQTEEQILDLCSNVGPITNLKMMFDPQTGKSKGYAFVEYKDLESSASAVRNLNGYQFGSRLLKCGYATGNDMESHEPNNNDDSSNLKFSRLPAGVDVNINMTTPAMMISSELAKKGPNEQLSLLRVLQDWTRKNPEDAVELLRGCPQLSFVIAELLLTNGISNVDDLTQLAVQRNDTPEGGASASEGVQDPGIQTRQRELLRQVLQLSDSEIAVLPDDEKMSLWDLKQRATRGEFGLI